MQKIEIEIIVRNVNKKKMKIESIGKFQFQLEWTRVKDKSQIFKMTIFFSQK